MSEGPLHVDFVARHVEALATRQARIELERDLLVRLLCEMHRQHVITIEYGAIGSETWNESLSYDEDVVLRRILDANL